LTLHRIGMHRQRILDAGYILPMATSRGPLCTAGFVRGTTHFMIDLVENPKGAHKLIDLCTRVTIDWLKAQIKVMGPTVREHFHSRRHRRLHQRRALPGVCAPLPEAHLRRFPEADWVKLYHNDAEVDACLDHLPDTGFNVLNWGKQKATLREVKQRVGRPHVPDGQCESAGNRVRGTPEEVKDETLEVLEGSGGEGIILSVGGGTSPGMPRENILAMLDALNEFNGRRAASGVSSR
jgi:uroporphyrinogen-III decarboxylase